MKLRGQDMRKTDIKARDEHGGYSKIWSYLYVDSGPYVPEGKNTSFDIRDPCEAASARQVVESVHSADVKYLLLPSSCL